MNNRSRSRLHHAFDVLLARHGPQGWWPAESAFEVMVGAVMVQNTAWTNVERAIANLRRAGMLDARPILELSPGELGALIRPAGYFNVKAKRLRHVVAWYVERGGMERLKYWSTHRLRASLLAVHGVGKETADDILLYAFHRPVFVVDAYTRRIYDRLGIGDRDGDYEHLRSFTEDTFERRVRELDEWHALLVAHGKDTCRPKPRCGACALVDVCEFPGKASREGVKAKTT